MAVSWLSLGMSVMMLLVVLELVRRHQLTFRYALSWLTVSVAGVFFSIFHELLFNMSKVFGFELPSNFIFFALSVAFVFLTLLMTVFLCQQHRRNEQLAQRIAILEMRLEQRST